MARRRDTHTNKEAGNESDKRRETPITRDKSHKNMSQESRELRSQSRLNERQAQGKIDCQTDIPKDTHTFRQPQARRPESASRSQGKRGNTNRQEEAIENRDTGIHTFKRRRQLNRAHEDEVNTRKRRV